MTAKTRCLLTTITTQLASSKNGVSYVPPGHVLGRTYSRWLVKGRRSRNENKRVGEALASLFSCPLTSYLLYVLINLPQGGARICCAYALFNLRLHSSRGDAV